MTLFSFMNHVVGIIANFVFKLLSVMKRTLSLAFAVLTAVALFVGCTKTPINGHKSELELSNVSANETKAVIDGTVFPKDGHIGLFLFKDESAVTPYGDTGCSNVEYSYNGDNGKWTANPPITVGGEPGYLYGYYPYNSSVTDIKSIPVASSLDGDDVMYATKQTVTDETASQTAIKMNHALARVTITVVNNGYTLGEGELSSIKFSGAEASVSGILDATSGIISGTTKADVILDVPSGKQTITAEGTVYECLLVPSEEESLVQTLDLTLNIDGNDKTTTLSGDTGVTIARNTKSNVTIALSNTGISVQTVSIEDWNVVEVGGYKVSVKLDKGASGIDKDVWMKAYAEAGNAIIEVFSISDKRITCQLDDDTMVSPVEGGDIRGDIRGDVSEEIIESEGIEVTKFVIPVETKDVVATVGVWGEGGRKEITVGGHKVKVVYEELEDIEKDVWMAAYAVGDTAKIEAFSKEFKPLIIHTADGPSVAPVEMGSISTFSISDITSDITATLAYAEMRTVKVNVAGVDKAPMVEGYVYGTGNPINVIEGRPSLLTANPGGGYAVDYLEMKGIRYADYAMVFIPDDVETIDAYFRYIDMLSGVFSVSDTKKVRFSRGNLWCDGTGDGYSDQNPVIKSFGTETNQYESTPSGNGIRSTNHISHFTWCNDASNSVCEMYDYSWDVEGVCIFTNADETTPNPDFAANGQQGIWRVLSGGPGGEWEYLIDKRQQDNRFAKAKVHGRNGLLLFPDGYSLPSGYISDGGKGMSKSNDENAGFPSENIPDETWIRMDAAGVVFLPAAGYRRGDPGCPNPADVFNVGDYGCYWSASPNNDSSASFLNFSSGGVYPSLDDFCYQTYSVRLVTEYQSEPSAE